MEKESARTYAKEKFTISQKANSLGVRENTLYYCGQVVVMSHVDYENGKDSCNTPPQDAIIDHSRSLSELEQYLLSKGAVSSTESVTLPSDILPHQVALVAMVSYVSPMYINEYCFQNFEIGDTKIINWPQRLGRMSK